MKAPEGRMTRPGDILFGPRITSAFQRPGEIRRQFSPDLLALFLKRRPVLGWD
jgi:hypothetical protein